MTMISIVQTQSRDAYPVLIAGIKEQFGAAGSVSIASEWLQAEWAEFHWDSRIDERWLGRYEGESDGEDTLDRVAIVGRLNGVWFAATCIVDGDGGVRWLQHLELLKDGWDADEAFVRLA
jgi:hypothetical protein